MKSNTNGNDEANANRHWQNRIFLIHLLEWRYVSIVEGPTRLPSVHTVCQQHIKCHYKCDRLRWSKVNFIGPFCFRRLRKYTCSQCVFCFIHSLKILDFHGHKFYLEISAYVKMWQKFRFNALLYAKIIYWNGHLLAYFYSFILCCSHTQTMGTQTNGIDFQRPKSIFIFVIDNPPRQSCPIHGLNHKTWYDNGKHEASNAILNA